MLFRALLLAGALSALGGAPAGARSYVTVSCDAAPGGANRAWTPTTNSRALGTRAVCPTRGHADRGLSVTARAGARARVPYGARAQYRLMATAGTEIRRLVFAGRFVRRTAGWRVGIDSDRGFFAGCPSGPAACPPSRRSTTTSLKHARWVRLIAVCLLVRGCATRRGRLPAVEGHLSYAAVTIGDDGPPVFRNVGGGATERRWLRGTELLSFAALDASGVRAVGAAVNGKAIEATRARSCDYTRARPCADLSPEVYALRTSSDPFVDGRNVVQVGAVDAAGNAATFRREVFVDNHAPGQVLDIASLGGEDWRAKNRFDVSWTDPGGQVAPIVAARYRLCAAAGCLPDQRVAGSGISRLTALTVPWAGDWTLRAWLEDAAGNSSSETRSAPLRLRFDDVAPVAVFEAPNPRDPRRVDVSVSDPLSGVVAGAIEIRRSGEPSWTALSAHLEPGRVTATIDDHGARPGTYELRSLVRDAAGNETTSEQRRDGGRALLHFPLRLATRVDAGLARGSVRRCPAHGHGPCRRLTRRPASSLRVPLGRAVSVTGRLTTTDGRRPVSGALIHVVETPRSTGRSRVIGVAMTGGSGAFRYRVGPGPSRRIELRYEGSDTTTGAARSVTTLVRAASTLHVDRARVLNGDSVLFSGRLRGGHVPAGGKLVTLQARVPRRRRWITFATPTTDGAGRWSSRYRFESTSGVVRYRFRVIVPRETGYPFEEGRSPSIAVLVRGR